ILDHPRFHTQAAVFLERFAGQRERVLAKGEVMRLAESGNHCQGTLFRDGGDLWSEAFEDRVDQIARAFRPTALFGGASAREGEPLLDIGRFDVRYTSDEAVRRGEGFAIVEFNGTAGESTNIYDP